MAMASTSLHQSLSPKYPHFFHNSRLPPTRLRFTSLRFPSTIRATSAVSLEPEKGDGCGLLREVRILNVNFVIVHDPDCFWKLEVVAELCDQRVAYRIYKNFCFQELSTQQSQTLEADPFACPICYQPLIRKGPPGFNLPAIYRSGFKCNRCNKTYSSKENYLDLTITAGMKDYTEVKPARTELFRNPLVSFLYERGWRQNFNQSGFPGPDEEFKMAQEYFKPAEGGLLVDVSCEILLLSGQMFQDFPLLQVQLMLSMLVLPCIAGHLLPMLETLPTLCLITNAICPFYVLVWCCLDLVHRLTLFRVIPTLNIPLEWLSSVNSNQQGPDSGISLLSRLRICFVTSKVAEICRALRSGGVFVGTTFLQYSSTTSWIERPFREGTRKPAWLEALYTQKFFAGCSYHETAKKNEKNVCCLDCCISICPHCIPSHRFHSLLQVRRYVYHDVVRLEDLEKLIDCSNVQAYTINSAKVVFIKKRPQNRQFKGAGNYCTSCDRSLQEPFLHCSLGCKVDYVLKHYRDLSPYLRRCNALTLGPDFFIPQDLADDEMTNETWTPHSTVVDSDEPLSWSSSSSGSENMSMATSEIVRKKRSGLYVCARSMNRVSDEDIASSMSRRKGIPHRSPLC
ncbi:hypothetical protein DKX38_009175 [Salix brachista]|uniref:B box-type domain-containing protein n=1 Tax=Salix brachista TaxID=2182728 RepID=A0A5N5M9Q6_9ROSI|nr:hypothetical protein DKX38_009175 [Salix brachista]